MKIGKEVTVKEDIEIYTTLSHRVIRLKEGDKGFLDSKGLLHVTNGDGRGKIVKIDGMDVKGYDHENISKMIYQRLNGVYGLENFLVDEDIEYKDFISEIEDILMDIL